MKIDRLNNMYDKYLDNKKAKDDRDMSRLTSKQSIVDVDISDAAKALVKKIGQSEETVFSEKVENIRRNVENGSYKVSSEKIADSIMKLIKSQEGRDI